MTLGSTIAYYRKKKELTQEMLARKLDVTNQAVSKWETDQCCPDTALLPRLADVLGITIDNLFGRETTIPQAELPWEDDGAFHIVLYHGHELIGGHPAGKELTFCYEGPAKDIYCSLDLTCGDVSGSVHAKGSVECGDVGGNAESAGNYVECGDVGGNVSAGGYVECADVGGNVSAGAYAECADVGGSINAGSYVECGDVEGNVTAGGHVDCGEVGGYMRSSSGQDGDLGKAGGFSFRFDSSGK